MRSRNEQRVQLGPETVLYGFAAAVRRLGSVTPMIGGSIAFEIEGDAGGRWRLDLDVAGGALLADDHQPSGTTLRATPDAMVAFFETPAEIPRLCRERALSVTGEAARIRDLAHRLKQTRSWLDRG